jgi:hypothetical protein
MNSALKHTAFATAASLCLLAWFCGAYVAHAQEFVPLAPLPGITGARDPSQFFNAVFRYGVIIAAFLAVIMIVIGGFQYMTTEAVSGKGEAKGTITSALAGLFLILLSVVILQIINPDILDFNLFR